MRRAMLYLGYALVLIVLLSAAVGAMLTYPEPLFTHSVQVGRLSLHSDRPFDRPAGEHVLADVERRLAKAPRDIADQNSTYRIFVANTELRRRITFLWHDGAGGLNYYPIAGSVFIRQSDINRDRVLRSDGDPVEPPRTLAYFAAHEIAHSLVGKRVGAIANWQLPHWIREGLCDYVGFGGNIDVAALARLLRAGDPSLDPRQSGTYARYRLLVAYYLKHENWSVDRLLRSGLSQDEAERALHASPLGR